MRSLTNDNRQAADGSGKGKVYLIGAGPGDPKLITVRGMEALSRADVVVYDRLASPRLMKYARPDAEMIYVGKQPDKHAVQQDRINQILVQLAAAGKTVARLKGGDPSIFGRVGEEAEELAANGLPFEIIPGITSSIAVPAYAGIPVTHRNYTSSVAIVTGHENPDRSYTRINWDKLATANETTVFLMGVTNLPHICEELIRWGKPGDTPVAVIRWGTTMEQRTIVGTLSTIVQQVREAKLLAPAIIVVGEVVRLREKLQWFENRPLFGRRVLVTRARSQASELAERIDELGGEPVEFPVIETRKPADPQKLRKLDEALAGIESFDWLLFTSATGVEFFLRSLQEKGIDIRRLHRARIGAVGPATAEALASCGLIAERLPENAFRAEGLLDALLPELRPGQRVLLPRADIARSFLPDKLRELGLSVTDVDVYETVASDQDAAQVIELLQGGDIHLITFTSSSTVTYLIDILRRQGIEQPAELLRGIETACIGPLTAETARQAGLDVTYVAKQATIDSLVDTVVDQLGGNPPQQRDSHQSE